MAISTPLLALLAGGAQGYGDMVQRRQSAQQDQQAETARQLLAAAITRGQQAQQNTYETNRENAQNQFESGLRASDQAYDTNTRKQTALDDYSNGPGEGEDYDTVFNHLTGVMGYLPDQATKILGPRKMVPGAPLNIPAMKQPAPTAPTDPQTAALLNIIAKGRGPVGLQPRPGLAPGATVPGPPVQNPNQIPFPIDPKTQAAMDAKTQEEADRATANNVRLETTYQGQIQKVDPKYRAAWTGNFNLHNHTSFTQGDWEGVGFNDITGKGAAQIAASQAGTKEKGAQTNEIETRIPLIKMDTKLASAKIPQITAQITHLNALTDKINNSPTPVSPQTKEYLGSLMQRASQTKDLLDSAYAQYDSALKSSAPGAQTIVAEQKTLIANYTDELSKISTEVGRVQGTLNAAPSTTSAATTSYPPTLTRNGKTYHLYSDGNYYPAQ